MLVKDGCFAMLTHQQILQFAAFGYVVMPGALSQAETAMLLDEVEGALTDAFGPAAGRVPDDLGGIEGDYLPLAADRTPFAQALIADDQRTFLACAELLGGPVVPSVGVATRFLGDSSWHTRQGPALGGVTIWADLEPRTAQTGALRVVPGSHLPDFERQLCQYRAAEPASSGFGAWEWPHVVIETEPGDLVAFHTHLMNRTAGGAPRLTWMIEYLPWPGITDRDRLGLVRGLIADDLEFDHEDYDRDRWPVWSDWASAPAPSLSRAIALERLHLLGVLSASALG